MDYDRIIIELMNRVSVLEERVDLLEIGKSAEQNEMKNTETKAHIACKKYRYLTNYLLNSNKSKVTLSFSELEEIIGFPLPASAKKHRAFWANTNTHSIALSWMSCGYEIVDADMEKEYITFEKI